MQTITKTAEEIQPGDVFITSYGDYDNICKFVFVSCEPHGKKWTKVNVHYVNKDEIFDVYDSDPIDRVRFEVIVNENSNSNN